MSLSFGGVFFCRYPVPNTAARHQHFDKEGRKRTGRAQRSRPERGEQKARTGPICLGSRVQLFAKASTGSVMHTSLQANTRSRRDAGEKKNQHESDFNHMGDIISTVSGYPNISPPPKSQMSSGSCRDAK
jgi:hypothetical protein